MDALSLIRQFEGFRETPYWDVNAYRTGYGSDTITTADGRVIPVQQGMSVSREDAERDLMRRVQTEFAPRAAAAVGPMWERLSEPQRAALISITYNYGSLPSSVAKAVASGDLQAATGAIRALQGHNDGINAKRRNEEADLFSGALGESDYAGGAMTGTYAPPGDVVSQPGQPEQDPMRLAWAYRNGKMSPEDAAMYERGIAAGVFPRNDPFTVPQQTGPDPLEVYQRVAMQRPSQFRMRA